MKSSFSFCPNSISTDSSLSSLYPLSFTSFFLKYFNSAAHMENVLSPLQKRLSPQHKATKKKKNTTQQPQQQPLKVVYITNPIKFQTTASQFKALVQELTGKNADYSPAEAAGGGYQPCAATALKTVLEEEEEDESGRREQEKMERPGEGGSNPVELECGRDSFHSPLMIEDFQGMVDSDILQNLLCENN